MRTINITQFSPITESYSQCCSEEYQIQEIILTAPRCHWSGNKCSEDHGTLIQFTVKIRTRGDARDDQTPGCIAGASNGFLNSFDFYWRIQNGIRTLLQLVGLGRN